MPPSAVGTNRFAGQAVTQVCTEQFRQWAVSTSMCAVGATRKSTVASRSSKLTPAHSPTGMVMLGMVMLGMVIAVSRPSSIAPRRGVSVPGDVAQPHRRAAQLGAAPPDEPRLGPGVVDAEDPLGQPANQLRIVLLHPLREHEVRRPPQLAVVAEHEASLQPAPVTGQPRHGGIAGGQRLIRGAPGCEPRTDRVVDALEPVSYTH